jgi:hypothetical protein
MSGDYGRFQPIYGMSIVDVDLPQVGPLITAKAANRSIAVQRIQFEPSTWNGATLSFYDSVTLVQIASLYVPTVEPTIGDASSSLNVDLGPTGTKLAPGSNLAMSGSATGRLHIEAYQKGPLPGVPLNRPYSGTAGFTK